MKTEDILVAIPGLDESYYTKSLSRFLNEYNLPFISILEVVLCDILFGVDDTLERLLYDKITDIELDKFPFLKDRYTLQDSKKAILTEWNEVIFPVKQFYYPYLHEIASNKNITIFNCSFLYEDFTFMLTRYQ